MRSFPARCVAVVALASSLAWAQAPSRLGYQGRLVKADGTALTGAQSLTFSLFNGPTGGTAAWTETQSLGLSDGYYATVLGDATDGGVRAALFDGAEKWLELSVGGVTLAPRQRVDSVAYALSASRSRDVVGGVADVTSVAINGTPVIDSTGKWVGPPPTVATDAGSGLVVVNGSVSLQACAASGDVLRWNGSAWACAAIPAGLTGDFIVNQTASAQDAGFHVGGDGLVGGRLGVGVAAPLSKLHVNLDALDTGSARLYTPTLPTGAGFGGGNFNQVRLGYSDSAFGSAFVRFNRDDTGGNLLTLAHWGDTVGMTVKQGGNVGIGTFSPAQKLSVAGTVESTSGGFKFPDATVQTTAAATAQLQAAFLTSGTSWSPPAGTTTATRFKFTLMGGGGAGGSATNNAQATAGGGGAGATTIVWLNGLSPSSAYTIAIGTAGQPNAFSGGYVGGSGTVTQLTVGATTYSAQGGAGGGGAPSIASGGPGAGGITAGANGTINIGGAPGDWGLYLITTGGTGGSSMWGGGGRGNAGGNGFPAEGRGAGGGGAGGNPGFGTTGGAGTPGAILVEWNQ